MDNPFKNDLIGAITLVDDMLHLRKEKMQIMDCLAISQIIHEVLFLVPEKDAREIKAEIQRKQLERVAAMEN